MSIHDTADVDLDVVPDDVKAICARLAEKGKRGWIVGGCVRDLLLGLAVADWDIATDAHPKEVMRYFSHVIPTGIAHGTVMVMRGDHGYEVTTLRGETTYSDGRRPDSVHFVDDITADLARRDFTINAIALDPRTGRLIDPFDGRRDLDARILRAVGDPEERFLEDGLRVLRAARFYATLEVELDDATRRAISGALDTFRKVSDERVRDEWIKTMKAKRPSRAFELMRESGVLAITCPELLEGVDMEQNRFHAYTVWRHAMECLDACPGDPILRIAALFHDIGKPCTRELSEKTGDYTFYGHENVGADMVGPITQRMRFSNAERKRIALLVRHHLIHYDEKWSDAAVRRWIRRVSPELLEDLYLLNEADVRAKGRDFNRDLDALALLKAHVARVLAAGDALSLRDLQINGGDLMKELGIEPGPVLGMVLGRLLDEVIADPGLNERAQLLARAEAILAETSS